MWSKYLLLCLLASSAAARAATYSYATAFADSCLSRGHGNGSSPYTATKPLSFAYEDGLMKQTLLRVHTATADPKYLAYVQAGMDVLLSANGTAIGGGYNATEFQLDSIQEGPALLRLHALTGAAKYKAAADVLVAQLDSQPTTAEGGYWHKAIYPSQMWLDGLFMAQPFRAAYIAGYGPTVAQTVAGVGLQFALVQKHLRRGRDAPAGTDAAAPEGELLLFHGYDESRAQGWASDVTGASPKVWGRALGWYAVAVVDTLDYLPANSSESAQLVEVAHGLAAGIAATQNANFAFDSARLWYQLVLEPTNQLNYIEASASAMFLYFLLKASRLGYIESRYSILAQEAYGDFVDKFIVQHPNGTLDLEGTVMVGNPATGYFATLVRINDMKGEAPFILASLEIDMLG